MPGNSPSRRSVVDISRSNRRIQELEERVSFLSKQVGKLEDLIGSEDPSVADLVKLLGKVVTVQDTTGGYTTGKLLWISRWNIGLKPTFPEDDNSLIIMFKGNLIFIVHKEGTENER